MPETIYWYDLETSGLDPVMDRAVQFAGQRTDLELNRVSGPETLYCRLSDDVLPSPEAMLVSGISIARLEREGLNELRFIERINAAFSVPGTCAAGFNNLRFDDEFVRHALYRNLFDPYAREWQGGNSRWDVIDLFRTAHALRPEGIEWPRDDSGAPIFRLEELARANGVEHRSAHDALSDVEATIALTALLRGSQPRLYDYLFDLRDKRRVLDQLYPLGKRMVLHVSGMYPAARGCLAIVLPMCAHPTNSNGILLYDLSVDPTPLIELPPEEINRLLFTPSGELGDEERIALKTLHINRSPSVAPLTTLSESTCDRFGLDRGRCEEHMDRLRHTAGVVEKLHEALTLTQFPAREDPDFMLYEGEFFSPRDRQAMERVRNAAPEAIGALALKFDDGRLPEMVYRFRARNYPDTLDAEERSRWRALRLERWQGREGLRAYRDGISRLLATHRGSARDAAVLEELERYADEALQSVDVS